MASVNPIPDGYPRLSPSMPVDGAAKALDYYCDVFGFTVRMRMDGPDGRVGHSELQLGDSVLMVADEFPDIGFLGPGKVGGCPVVLSIYVEDVDAVVEKALATGATLVRPVENQFYGDRSGMVEDPFGYRWSLATHVEDVSPEEMDRRAQEYAQQS